MPTVPDPREPAGGPGAGHPVDLGRLDDLIGPLVAEAGLISLQRFRSSVVAEDKGGSGGYDPVTAADRLTESFLRRELSALFPETRIIGEEGGTTGPAGRTTWTIDPIDGTRAYVSGMPLWGLLLGLMVDGRPVAGWCRQPYLDETFAGIAGTGFLEHAGQRRALHTRSTTDLAAATMYSTHPAMFLRAWERAAFEALAGAVRLQRFGGDCYSYCMLALGHVDLVVEAGLQSYDIVPLIPIVEAAGGVVTSPDGGAPVDGGFVVAAATPELHAEALTLVAAARAAAGR
jgi:myo-inositol-1(or 4)-monophosphatase